MQRLVAVLKSTNARGSQSHQKAAESYLGGQEAGIDACPPIVPIFGTLTVPSR